MILAWHWNADKSKKKWRSVHIHVWLEVLHGTLSTYKSISPQIWDRINVKWKHWGQTVDLEKTYEFQKLLVINLMRRSVSPIELICHYTITYWASGIHFINFTFYFPRRIYIMYCLRINKCPYVSDTSSVVIE